MDFREAARFEDELQIAVSVAELGQKSVTYRFVFSRDGHELAEGTMTSACCRIVPGSRPKSIPIPDAIRQKLSPLAG